MTTNTKTPHQERVEAMMNRIRMLGELPPIPSKPSIPDSKMILAQAKLILEEAFEVLEACGVSAVLTGILPEERLLPGDIVRRDDLRLVLTGPVMSLPDVAKELADLSVVTTGMFSEFGIPDESILEAVDNNNLAKFGPGGYLNDERKWCKPPNHPKPDLKSLLGLNGDGQPENDNAQNAETAPVSH